MARLRKPSGRPLFDTSTPSDFARRRSGFRKPYPKILIICEGQQEECYFNLWKKQLSPREIKVIPISIRGGNPIICVQRALAERKNIAAWDDYRDQCWCCFDAERTEERGVFLEAIHEATNKNIKLATSVPSFEYWILLHFQQGNSPFQNSRDLDKKICKLIPDYHHGKDISKILFPLTSEAVKNAEYLREQNRQGWENYDYPSTQVDLLITEFMELIKD